MNAVWDVGQSFVHEVAAARVVFGIDSRLTRLRGELDRLWVRRPALVATPALLAAGEQALEAAGLAAVGRVAAYQKSDGASGVPAGEAALAAGKPDVVVALGGGCTTCAGRVWAAAAGLPVICLPTTYSGAELRPDPGAPGLPQAIVYDPRLTLALPEATTVATGLYAMAQGIAACLGHPGSPLARLGALEGIRALADGLPDTVLDPQGLVGRNRALYGSYMANAAAAAGADGLQARLGAALSGELGLSSLGVQGVLLPYVARLYTALAPQTMVQIAAALGADDASEGLARLVSEVGAPASLKALGMRRSQLAGAAAAACRRLPAEIAGQVPAAVVRELFEDAFAGRAPAAVYGSSALTAG